MFSFEKRHEKLISRAAFLRRLGHSFFVCSMLVGISLFAGMAGYHFLEDISWTDSFLNASMLLGGMGPVTELKTEAGKIFAGLYALYSGLAFLVLAGLLFGPVAHRVLHNFHYGSDGEGKGDKNKS